MSQTAVNSLNDINVESKNNLTDFEWAKSLADIRQFSGQERTFTAELIRDKIEINEKMAEGIKKEIWSYLLRWRHTKEHPMYKQIVWNGTGVWIMEHMGFNEAECKKAAMKHIAKIFISLRINPERVDINKVSALGFRWNMKLAKGAQRELGMKKIDGNFWNKTIKALYLKYAAEEREMLKYELDGKKKIEKSREKYLKKKYENIDIDELVEIYPKIRQSAKYLLMTGDVEKETLCAVIDEYGEDFLTEGVSASARIKHLCQAREYAKELTGEKFISLKTLLGKKIDMKYFWFIGRKYSMNHPQKEGVLIASLLKIKENYTLDQDILEGVVKNWGLKYLKVTPPELWVRRLVNYYNKFAKGISLAKDIKDEEKDIVDIDLGLNATTVEKLDTDTETKKELLELALDLNEENVKAHVESEMGKEWNKKSKEEIEKEYVIQKKTEIAKIVEEKGVKTEGMTANLKKLVTKTKRINRMIQEKTKIDEEIEKTKEEAKQEEQERLQKIEVPWYKHLIEELPEKEKGVNVAKLAESASARWTYIDNLDEKVVWIDDFGEERKERTNEQKNEFLEKTESNKLIKKEIIKKYISYIGQFLDIETADKKSLLEEITLDPLEMNSTESFSLKGRTPEGIPTTFTCNLLSGTVTVDNPLGEHDEANRSFDLEDKKTILYLPSLQESEQSMEGVVGESLKEEGEYNKNLQKNCQSCLDKTFGATGLLENPSLEIQKTIAYQNFLRQIDPPLYPHNVVEINKSNSLQTDAYETLLVLNNAINKCQDANEIHRFVATTNKLMDLIAREKDMSDDAPETDQQSKFFKDLFSNEKYKHDKYGVERQTLNQNVQTSEVYTTNTDHRKEHHSMHTFLQLLTDNTDPLHPYLKVWDLEKMTDLIANKYNDEIIIARNFEGRGVKEQFRNSPRGKEAEKKMMETKLEKDLQDIEK